MGSFVVTGAGLVGSWVARELTDMGHQVTLFDVAPPMQALSHWVDLDRVKLVRGDLQSLPEIINVIQEAKPEAVLHTASFLTAGVRERPYAGVQVNFMGTVNVLEAARIFGVPRVVFCSSGTVYTGMPGGLSMGKDEDFAMRVVSQRPRGLYAVCKLACEHVGYTYHDLYGMEFVAVRFGGVYGPWQGAMSGLPGRFVRKAVEPLIQGRVGEFDRAGMP
ncbi:MAG: NAD(P)-dependent oxidoreductase, partial [Chloroflexota bacterium]